MKLKDHSSIYRIILTIILVITLISSVFPQKESVTFINPASGYVSRKFLPDNGHMGIDYVITAGTPVFASAGGFVIFSGYTPKNGYLIIISHPDNYITIYKHCSSLIKKERDRISQGELIALSGNSGENTTGAHLHFEIWKNGTPIDPQALLLIKKE